MINPINGKTWFPELDNNLKKNSKKVQNKNIKSGVIIDIHNIDTSEDTDVTEKVEQLKKLIKEGKYPLNPQKLADKLLNFLTDVG